MIKYFVICSCLLMCFTSLVQSTEIEFAELDIEFVAGDTTNITVVAVSDITTTIYLEVIVFPDDKGFNLTYPESIDLIANQEQTFNITIRTSMLLAPGEYSISLVHYEYEKTSEGSSSRRVKHGSSTTYLHYPIDIEDDTTPTIPPKLDDPHNIFITSTTDTPSNWGYLCILLFIIFVIMFVIMVLYLNKYIIQKGEQQRLKSLEKRKNERKNKNK